SSTRFLLFFFFFSSRRRHTRWPRDWSSDVCSSDLGADIPAPGRRDERALSLAAARARTDQGTQARLKGSPYLNEARGLPENGRLDLDRHLTIADRIGRLRDDEWLVAFQNHGEVFADLGAAQRSGIGGVGRRARRTAGQVVLKVHGHLDLAIRQQLRLRVDVERNRWEIRVARDRPDESALPIAGDHAHRLLDRRRAAALIADRHVNADVDRLSIPPRWSDRHFW